MDADQRQLGIRKVLALTGLATWVSVLTFLSGPARWELAHTYGHLIDGAEGDLPALTASVALPFLGLGPDGFVHALTKLLVWSVLWLGAAALVWLAWTAPDRRALTERLVLGLTIYVPAVVLLVSVLAVALWLPFSLLSGS